MRALSVTGDARRWQQSDAETQEAPRAGLIDDVDHWMDFHAARNQTSHTYNRAIGHLPRRTLADLHEASDLPITVDVVDWNTSTGQFRDPVGAQLVRIA